MEERTRAEKDKGKRQCLNYLRPSFLPLDMTIKMSTEVPKEVPAMRINRFGCH